MLGGIIIKILKKHTHRPAMFNIFFSTQTKKRIIFLQNSTPSSSSSLSFSESETEVQESQSELELYSWPSSSILKRKAEFHERLWTILRSEPNLGSLNTFRANEKSKWKQSNCQNTGKCGCSRRFSFACDRLRGQRDVSGVVTKRKKQNQWNLRLTQTFY